METRWRDLVILDYEVDFPSATVYELDLYSAGVLRFPGVVLGLYRDWGQIRRPGLVEIEQRDYDWIIGEFGKRCTTSSFLSRVQHTLGDLVRLGMHSCDVLDRDAVGPKGNTSDTLAQLTQMMKSLMAFHVINWALPLDLMLEKLTAILGDKVVARETLLELLVPFTSSHILDVFVLADSPETQMLSIAREIGDRQSRAMARRIMRLLLRSYGDEEKLEYLANLVKLCRLAAEEEETRRRLQDRVLHHAERAGMCWPPPRPATRRRHNGGRGETDGGEIARRNSPGWAWLHVY